METQNQESYSIKTAGFEGPLGLLLELIEKRKLFINDVSLASVTEDYLNYMNGARMDSGQIASFVLVAATLILIKSKSLLPNLALTAEEQGDIKNLEERLRLYELFNRLGVHVRRDFGKQIIFAPLERKNSQIIFLPDNQISKDSMMTFAREVLGSMPKKIFLPEVEVRKVISIEEMIENLTVRITSAMKINFREFTGKSGTREEKINMIVGFLAMLELVRNGILDAVQQSHGEDIFINKLEPSNHEPRN